MGSRSPDGWDQIPRWACVCLLLQYLLPHAAFGWRIHCGVEVTELSTNKQHTLSQSCSRATVCVTECLFSRSPGQVLCLLAVAIRLNGTIRVRRVSHQSPVKVFARLWLLLSPAYGDAESMLRHRLQYLITKLVRRGEGVTQESPQSSKGRGGYGK